MSMAELNRGERVPASEVHDAIRAALAEMDSEIEEA